jgi:tetratricopeptide (TPR) repeat protein
MTPVISWLLIAQSLPEAISSYNRGEYVEAERALRQLESSPVRDLYFGLTLAATSRCPEADPLLMNPPPGEVGKLAALARAQCRIAASDGAGALAVLEPMAKLFPDDPDVLYLLARAHMRGFNSAVERMFAGAAASYRVNQLSAEVFEQQGRFAEAVGEYRKAIAKNPRAVNLHYRMGRALLMESNSADQLQAARAAFEAELALNPNDAAAEFQVAQILDAQGDGPASQARFERVLRLNPDFVPALIALGKKGGGKAIERLERAVSLEPRHEAARYALMIAYRNAGRTEDARRAKTELDQLRQAPEGEFTNFLKRLGEKPPAQP